MLKLMSIFEELLNRSDMPQVDQSDLSAAVKILTDAGIDVSMRSVDPSSLRHSQTKVNKQKIRSIASDIESGKKMPPIVISSDGSIIDGHHRQMAYIKLGTNPVRAVQINLPRDRAITAYKKVEDIV